MAKKLEISIGDIITIARATGYFRYVASLPRIGYHDVKVFVKELGSGGKIDSSDYKVERIGFVGIAKVSKESLDEMYNKELKSIEGRKIRLEAKKKILSKLTKPSEIAKFLMTRELLK